MESSRRGLIRPHEKLLGILYRSVDVVALFAMPMLVVRYGAYSESIPLAILAPVSAAAFSLVADALNLYRSWRTSGFLRWAAYTALAWTISCGAIVLTAEMFTDLAGRWAAFAIRWYFFSLASLVIWRLAFRVLLRWLRQRKLNSRSAIIVGVNEESLSLAKQIREHDELGIRLLGFYDDRLDPERHHDQQVLGTSRDAVELARAGEVDWVFIAFPMRAEIRIQRLLEELADSAATVFIVPSFLVGNLLSSRWHAIGEVRALSVFDTPTNGLGGRLKRAEDIAISLALIAVMAIPMLLIATAIRLASDGPVLFIQERYGLGTRKIKVLKFRTMHVMENGDKVVQAKRCDTRVTKFGRWLRAASLDELPQLFNVLAGSMSIVGPRPHAVAHNEEYRKNIHGYMLRHKVKPGMTGWAQINGYRGETDTLWKMESRVRYDLDYINKWSLWLDLKILLLTIARGAMFDKNAY